MKRLMTKEDRAAYKASFIKGKTKVAIKGTELEFYLSDTAGRFSVMAFRGTAGKPFAHYWYKSAAQRAGFMAREIEGAKATAAYKAKKTTTPRKLEVGHILYTSWGYDQTNTDFYQVTALKGATMVMVRKLAASTEEKGYMSGTTFPTEEQIGEPIACRVRNGDSITVDGHSAWIWGGTPKAVSWYA